MFLDINTLCVVSSHLETLCMLAHCPMRLQRHPTIRPSTKERAQIPSLSVSRSRYKNHHSYPSWCTNYSRAQSSCHAGRRPAGSGLQGGWGATPLTASAAFFMDQLVNLLSQLNTLSLLKLQFSTEEYD